ncbi:MAG: host-nuclease inhibitor Gam family protein [Rhodospirillales bacterium]
MVQKTALTNPVYHPRAEAEFETINAAIDRVGYLRREIDRTEGMMNDAIAAVKQSHEAAAAPLKKALERLEGLVERYCTKHRNVLTENHRYKFAEFPAGAVSWRSRPPSIQADEESVLKYLKRCRKKAFKRFIRTAESIDKQALLKVPHVAALIKGVTIIKGEEVFVIKPVESDLAPGKPEAAA